MTGILQPCVELCQRWIHNPIDMPLSFRRLFAASVSGDYLRCSMSVSISPCRQFPILVSTPFVQVAGRFYASASCPPLSLSTRSLLQCELARRCLLRFSPVCWTGSFLRGCGEMKLKFFEIMTEIFPTSDNVNKENWNRRWMRGRSPRGGRNKKTLQ